MTTSTDLAAELAALGLEVGGDVDVARGCDHPAELILARRAAAGDARAIRAFELHVGPEIERAARRLGGDAAFVDEVRQAVRVRLLVSDGDEAPRLASYRGAGPLRAWVRVTATRVGLNLKRGGLDLAPADVLEDLADREPDPELRHLKTLYRAEFREALEAAIRALPDRSRALLRLTYVNGLRLAAIGRLYDVHESTASRWLKKATEQVASGARSRLIERLAISGTEVDSVARLVQSGLELSIARILEK